MTAIAELQTTTADMAKVLGISPRRLQQLAKDGWINGRAGRDRWQLGETCQSYFTHVRLCAIRGSDPSYL